MIKFFCLTVFLFAITSAEFQAHSAFEFGRFSQKFGKSYTSFSEQAYRLRVYQQNVEFINKHNAKGLPYKLAINHYADLTHSEFQERVLGFRVNNTRKGGKHYAGFTNIPKSVDWREKGAVTEVKDQGTCGSCWAFSTTGAVEGAWFLSKGKLVSLSEQNLVECSGDQGNNGCNGGLMDNAFQYIIDNKGIDSEDSYQYTGEEGTCQFKSANVAARISSFKDVAPGDETALLTAVAQQPVSVAIDASQRSFQFYATGVYYDENCSSEDLDHGVLAVGYGTDEVTGKDYWLVKNSWGSTWGDKGFIKMSRNADNNCGIATAASYPVV